MTTYHTTINHEMRAEITKLREENKRLRDILVLAQEALETCESDPTAVGADGGLSFDEDKVDAARAALEKLND